MIDIMLICFKTLLVLMFIPLEFIIKITCAIITFVISIIYVLLYPIVKYHNIPQWVDDFCKYGLKYKGSFKLTKIVIKLWS